MKDGDPDSCGCGCEISDADFRYYILNPIDYYTYHRYDAEVNVGTVGEPMWEVQTLERRYKAFEIGKVQTVGSNTGETLTSEKILVMVFDVDNFPFSQDADEYPDVDDFDISFRATPRYEGFGFYTSFTIYRYSYDSSMPADFSAAMAELAAMGSQLATRDTFQHSPAQPWAWKLPSEDVDGNPSYIKIGFERIEPASSSTSELSLGSSQLVLSGTPELGATGNWIPQKVKDLDPWWNSWRVIGGERSDQHYTEYAKLFPGEMLVTKNAMPSVNAILDTWPILSSKYLQEPGDEIICRLYDASLVPSNLQEIDQLPAPVFELRMKPVLASSAARTGISNPFGGGSTETRLRSLTLTPTNDTLAGAKGDYGDLIMAQYEDFYPPYITPPNATTDPTFKFSDSDSTFYTPFSPLRAFDFPEVFFPRLMFRENCVEIQTQALDSPSASLSLFRGGPLYFSASIAGDLLNPDFDVTDEVFYWSSFNAFGYPRFIESLPDNVIASFEVTGRWNYLRSARQFKIQHRHDGENPECQIVEAIPDPPYREQETEVVSIEWPGGTVISNLFAHLSGAVFLPGTYTGTSQHSGLSGPTALLYETLQNPFLASIPQPGPFRMESKTTWTDSFGNGYVANDGYSPPFGTPDWNPGKFIHVSNVRIRQQQYDDDNVYVTLAVTLSYLRKQIPDQIGNPGSEQFYLTLLEENSDFREYTEGLESKLDRIYNLNGGSLEPVEWYWRRLVPKWYGNAMPTLTFTAGHFYQPTHPELSPDLPRSLPMATSYVVDTVNYPPLTWSFAQFSPIVPTVRAPLLYAVEETVDLTDLAITVRGNGRGIVS